MKGLALLCVLVLGGCAPEHTVLVANRQFCGGTWCPPEVMADWVYDAHYAFLQACHADDCGKDPEETVAESTAR